LIWLACRDPFVEAEIFAKKRVPAGVNDLIAWEVDFIRELLDGLNVEFLHVTDPALIRDECHVLVYSVNQFRRSQIRRGLRLARPRVVFHLSDEWGNRGNWHRILRGVPLVLRQYHFNAYPSYDTIKTFPLGYMEGMLPASSTSPAVTSKQKPMRMRRYSWSFIGTVTGFRAGAIDTFADLGPNHVGSAHPADMRGVYLDSKFVLCPAGYVNILCFRNFEASLCGAIPIVAGCSAEHYHEAVDVLGNPPWVFREAWEDALAEVRTLLDDDERLESIRHEVLAWWRTQVEAPKSELRSALGNQSRGRSASPRKP
jgi:hypothetical protein